MRPTTMAARAVARDICKRYYSSSANSYDAVVIGGGHNGLVAAAYLAKSGKSVCVVERRGVLGGAAVTEEIVPGYKFSRASYVLSLLRPRIFRDLELKKHGLTVYLRKPSSYTPLKQEYQKPGGPKSLTLGSDAAENRRQIGAFSSADAESYERYEEQLEKFVDTVDPLIEHAPSKLLEFAKAGTLQKLRMLEKIGPVKEAVRQALKSDPTALYELMTAPTTKILDKWFESEPLKATLATDACIGAMISPSMTGSGYVLLHHVMGELEGERGAWGYPRGGMGAVSEAIASSARSAGADIRTNSPVKEITFTPCGQHASGVVLEDGTNISAATVLSNATPKVTFEKLIPEARLEPGFLRAVRNIDYTSPVTKINVAVNKLPNFTADPNTRGEEPMPHHRCTIHLNCENSQMLEDAFQDAQKGGIYSKKPLIEMTMPSSLDDSLAPKGHHVCLFFTQYTPYDLDWNDDLREKYANLIFDTVEEYAPGFKASIVGKEVLSPPDLEATFGLTGGNIFHGSMSLDQLYMTRPVASSDHMSPSTPVSGLFLCGSGAHPGGGVMGAPGRLAAEAAVQRLGGKWNFG